jgi:hypothetical protein
MVMKDVRIRIWKEDVDYFKILRHLLEETEDNRSFEPSAYRNRSVEDHDLLGRDAV